MTRVSTWLWMIAGSAGVCAAAGAAAQSRLPAGEGQAVVEKMCGTGCHTMEMVTPHRYTTAKWAQVVDDMVVRGAKGTDKEIDAVIRYLSTHLGRTDLAADSQPASAPSAPATPAPSTPSTLSRPANRPVMPLRSAERGWAMFGHDPGGQRFSPLTQITPENVAELQLAWKYETPAPTPSAAATNGESDEASRARQRRGRMSQVTPLVIHDVLYLTTSVGQVLALEPETGKSIWTYDVKNMGAPALRGPTYWPGDGESPPTLFVGTTGGYLIALNARTGQLVPGFAQGGVLNLRPGVADDFPTANYGITSPPVIYGNLVIAGSRVQEQPALGPSGDIRAFDARTGEQVWRFHAIPHPGEPGADTWEGDAWKNRSGANVWGFLTVDVERGLVYLPLGSVTYDYYGGDRRGANLYGSTLVALEAATGRLKWHFQTTHHDIWDYDLNAPPALIDVKREGRTIPAVAQMTKQGLLFILDRVTGEPIYGVEERPMLQDGFVRSERPWPTQPFPVKPGPLARNAFSPDEIATITPEHRQFCLDLLAQKGGTRTGGPYLPFGNTRPSLLFPGTLGGANWPGTSFNPELGYLFVNVTNLGEFYHMVQNPKEGWVAERWKFWDQDKFWGCQQPPWGELMAVDVNTADIVWRVPFGTSDSAEALGVKNTGMANIGGSIATAGGIVFIGGTVDERFRAFDARTGKELWVTRVGAAAHAVPITYQGRDGRQYVAVVVSGGGFLGDHTIQATLMVYALP